MFDLKLSNRPSDLNQMKILMSKFEEMTKTEKEIFENAVLEIYSMFEISPEDYQFDFRFNRI